MQSLPGEADPCNARFVVFWSHIPVWFTDRRFAADFAEKWHIPASKIHATRNH